MARAQATAPKWPDKTVRIVAAGPAGGSADIVARLLADQLSKQIGQPVIVDPQAGRRRRARGQRAVARRRATGTRCWSASIRW